MNFSINIIFVVFIFSFVNCKTETENISDLNVETKEFYPKKLTGIDSLKTDQQIENLVNRLLGNENHPFLIRKISEFKENPHYNYCGKLQIHWELTKRFTKEILTEIN